MSSARLAAEAHLAHQAYEAAISVVERSLGALEPSPEHAGARARLLALRAKAIILSGDSARGFELCREAAHVARKHRAAVALGEIALAWGLETKFSMIDSEHVALLEEALATLEPAEADLHIRLTARLAAALQPAREPARAVELARSALSRAREHRQTNTVAWVLFHARGAFRPLDSLEERHAWDREAFGCAKTHLMDGHQLGFDEAHFGAAFSMFGVVHFADPGLGLSEMHRVLRPGASMVVATWAAPRESSTKHIAALAEFGK